MPDKEIPPSRVLVRHVEWKPPELLLKHDQLLLEWCMSLNQYVQDILDDVLLA
jgi:hypothetical protein